MLDNTIKQVFSWIQDDWQAHPVRFLVEVTAWLLSISCSLIMAMTVPTPPLQMLYPMWISGCAMYLWASWTRGSFGMFANYCLLTTIDTIALIRMIIHAS